MCFSLGSLRACQSQMKGSLLQCLEPRNATFFFGQKAYLARFYPEGCIFGHLP